MLSTWCRSAITAMVLLLAAPTAASVIVGAEAARGGAKAVISRPKVYDYAPSAMKDEHHANGVYRMWWCGGIAGDHVLHAEARSLAGPWHAHGSSVPNSYDDTFAPTYKAGDFDGQHVCDPSVVRIGGVYWLYYGGYPKEGSTQPMTTAVGVAASADGLKFDRVQAGPLARPARSTAGLPNVYGAGQPSALALEGKVYLVFTDTSAKGSNAVNGAGIYAWRSPDPRFVDKVEVYGKAGWEPRTAENRGAHALLHAFSVDWAYSDVLQQFVVAANYGGGSLTVHFLDKQMQRLADGTHPFPGAWRDGPCIVTRGDGHAVLRKGAAQALPIDLLGGMADGGSDRSPNGWDIGWSGVDFRVGTAQPTR